MGASRKSGAGGGADEKPFGGAGNAAPGAAAFGDAQGVVTLFGEHDGFLTLVGEIVLGGGEFGLASLAVEGEVVERFEVDAGDHGTDRRFLVWWRGGCSGRGTLRLYGGLLSSVGSCRARICCGRPIPRLRSGRGGRPYGGSTLGLKSDRRRERNGPGKLSEDLRRSGDGALFGGELREGLLKLGVASVLTGAGGGEQLLGGGEFGSELRAVATVGAPGLEQSNEKDKAQENGDQFWPRLTKHRWYPNEGLTEIARLRFLSATGRCLCLPGTR